MGGIGGVTGDFFDSTDDKIFWNLFAGQSKDDCLRIEGDGGFEIDDIRIAIFVDVVASGASF